MSKQTKPEELSFTEMNAQLQAILGDMQRDDIDLDEALKQYERGQQLIAQLEQYLKTAENRIRKVTAKRTVSKQRKAE